MSKEFIYKQRPVTKEYEQNYDLIDWEERLYGMDIDGSDNNTGKLYDFYGNPASQRRKRFN